VGHGVGERGVAFTVAVAQSERVSSAPTTTIMYHTNMGLVRSVQMMARLRKNVLEVVLIWGCRDIKIVGVRCCKNPWVAIFHLNVVRAKGAGRHPKVFQVDESGCQPLFLHQPRVALLLPWHLFPMVSPAALS
jgi:hypothetical protein